MPPFPAPAIPPDGGTVYLTAADEQGMMVSYIQSNYKGFGSGIVIPGTGISLQNRGAGFTLEEGHPNRVAGGKRPYHTIIPGFVMKDGAPLMSFGVMGAHMQAQGHLQMMVRIFAGRQNPQAAADAPRWYLTEDSRLSLEPGFGPAVREELQEPGPSPDARDTDLRLRRGTDHLSLARRLLRRVGSAKRRTGRRFLDFSPSRKGLSPVPTFSGIVRWFLI